MEIFDRKKETLPHHTAIGGYPLFYITKDGGILCPDCANLQESKDADKNCPDDDQWLVIGYDINYENNNMYCSHCEKQIESAYDVED